MLTLTRPIISLDCEMTGVNAKIDRIVQIGLIKVYPDGTRKEWQTLVNPKMPIPVESTKVHGITDEMVENAPTFAALAPTLLAGFKDVDYVGFNVGFDLGFLEEEFKRVNLVFTRGKVIDGYRIFIKFERRDLTAAVEKYLGEKIEDAHDALADARNALRVVEAQLEFYPELPQTVDELHALFFETVEDGRVDPAGKFVWRNGVAVLGFGKHAGQPLRDCGDYLKWMLKGDFSEETKMICREALAGRYPKKSVEKSTENV